MNNLLTRQTSMLLLLLLLLPGPGKTAMVVWLQTE